MVEQVLVEGGEGETPPAPPIPEVDYKTEYEKAKVEREGLVQERDKLLQSLRSSQGVMNQRLDLEKELSQVRRAIAGQSALLQVIATATATGDTEAVQKNLADYRETAQRQEAEVVVTQEMRELWNNIGEELAEAHDIDLTNPSDGAKLQQMLASEPNLTPINTLAQQAFQENKPALLRQALQQAKALRRQAQVTRKQAQAKAIEDAQKEAKREAGLYNTTTPGATGSPSGSREVRLQALREKPKLTDSELAEFGKLLGR